MKKLATVAILAASMSSAYVSAQDLSITVTNLTHGQAFTPVLVAAHDATGNLFDVGAAASANLQAMAEGGALTGLQADLDAVAATHTAAGAPLLAGTSVTLALNTDAAPANTLLSVVGMLLPTNDGFIGLDSVAIPTTAGTYTFHLNGYDAGTEANDELLNPGAGGAPGVAGIPADPGLQAGMGGTVGVAGADSNATVHIHRGAIGDDDLTGGNSDLVNTVHRWLNPVARVTVVVN